MRYFVSFISALACILGLGFSTPTAASVVSVEFDKTASNPANLNVSIAYTIDEAGGNGFLPGSGPGSITNIYSLQIAIGGSVFNLDFFYRAMNICVNYPTSSICSGTRFSINLTPDGGTISYDGELDTIRLRLVDDHYAGTFSTDAPGPCNSYIACTFEGNFHRVPEPATALLFAMALLGLASARHLKCRGASL